MGHGALDVVDTPALGVGDAREAAAPLLRKILNIGWLIGEKPQRSRAAPTAQRSSASCQRLVAIGSSAGGPAALEVLLKGLPKDFSAAIVLVQHVDQVFAAGMAEWLASASGSMCAWPAKANHHRPARCCWPAPITIFAY
jgi:two-component system response regulator WspF